MTGNFYNFLLCFSSYYTCLFYSFRLLESENSFLGILSIVVSLVFTRRIVICISFLFS